MTQRATTSLSLHYQVKPSQKEGLLVEIKGMLDRCAKEPEFIMGILHETPERPNQFVLYELWKGTRAEFDATHRPALQKQTFAAFYCEWPTQTRTFLCRRTTGLAKRSTFATLNLADCNLVSNYECGEPKWQELRSPVNGWRHCFSTSSIQNQRRTLSLSEPCGFVF